MEVLVHVVLVQLHPGTQGTGAWLVTDVHG